jgi:predicted PurR-regulated permease PerM
VKQVARIVFWVLLTLAALALLWAFRGAVVLLLLSIAVADAVRPIIDRIHQTGVPFRLAIAAAYLACLGAIGLLVYVLAARLVVEIPYAADRLVEAYGHHMQRAISEFRGSAVAERALGGTMALLDLVGRILLVIAMSVYWTGGRDAIERLWLSFLPVERRRGARAIWIETRQAVGAQLRRELGLGILAGVALSVGLWLAGGELWALGTVAVLLLRLIPLLGAPLAVAAVVLTSLPSGLVPAILGPVIAIAVLTLLRVVVAPRWFPIERPLEPILAVVIILALAGSFGLAGLIAAPLVAAAIQTAYVELAAIRASEERLPHLDDLEARITRIERRLRWSSPPPAVANLLARLQNLVERAGG